MANLTNDHSAVPEAPRRRGRPRSFDTDQALDQAIALFWAKGYDGVSLDELAQSMGITRPSLQCAFGDKESLLRMALDRYLATIAARPRQVFDQANTIEEAVEGFLTEVARYGTETVERAGCLILVAAVTAPNDRFRAGVAANIETGEQMMAQRFQQAMDQGRLPANFDPSLAARRLMNARLFLGTRATHGLSLSDLRNDISDATEYILSARNTKPDVRKDASP